MSAQLDRLDIAGHRGEPVPNEFLRQNGDTNHLAVLLPGYGYTCHMPLFYYAESLLLDLGADVLLVEYAYNRRHGFLDLPKDEQRTWLLADASAAFRAGLTQRPYREVTLIGKSLGTLAMGHLVTENPPPIPMRAVWLTPLLRDDSLLIQMNRFEGPSLIAIGTADTHYDPILLAGLRATACEIVTIEGADHSMDIPGDASASIGAVEQFVTALSRFLRR